MDSDSPTPRVNFQTMQNYVGRKVLLACRVETIDSASGQLTVTTSDKATVTVTGGGAGGYNSPVVEIKGTVVDAKLLRAEEHTDLNDTFDFGLYNELVKLSHGRYADMFM